MKYNVITIADIHWGVIDPYSQLKQLEFIFEFLRNSNKSNIPIDLIVIAGDYFDSKLPLNSREAIISIQWFHELYHLAKEIGVKKIRMFEGTYEHDNDQLQVFHNLEDGDFFQIFYETTSEETLPGLECIYCPDELLSPEEYELKYVDEIMKMHDIGFYHGSFDVVYGELLEAKPELLKRKNVIFKYALWNNTIHGPMISGHWHDGKQYDSLYYVGSPFRYKFNEDEPKGFGFISYDTEDHSYLYEKILNPLSSEYVTFELYSNIYHTQEDYRRVLQTIDAIVETFKMNTHIQHRLRIKFFIVDEKPENDVFLTGLRHKFINDKNIKISVKNKIKDKIKKDAAIRNKQREEKYGFISDSTLPTCEKISSFLEQNDQYVPKEFIEQKIKQYVG